MKTLQNIDNLRRLRQQIEICDDFTWAVTVHNWTTLAADGGASVGVTDAVGGNLAVVTGGTDNNEAMIRTTNELFLLAADAPLIAESRLKFTDLAANAGNVAFGLADAAAANLLTDDTGAPSITTTGVLIYKVDGGTVWRVYSKNGANITDSVSTTTAGGTAWQALGIEILAVDGTNVEMIFTCNGSPLRDSNNRPIKHRMPYAAAGEMRLVPCYAKAGSANSLTVNCDYVYAAQRR